MGSSQSNQDFGRDQTGALKRLQDDICDCHKRHQEESDDDQTEVQSLCPEGHLRELAAVDTSLYDYPFENLVFEGGGMKCVAHVGALKVLQEAGILPRIRRVAGASGGALLAMAVGLDFTPEETEALITNELSGTMKPRCIDCCTLLPNALCKFGWKSMDSFDDHIAAIIAKKTGNADITFKEVYERTGREMCIVVINVNLMIAEYFHIKTTPNLPIRTAVRISMSLPGLYQPTLLNMYGNVDMYLDGGMFTNYAVHAFDGWWLSREPGDGFLQRMQPFSQSIKALRHSERFGTFNDKTLGIKLYSEAENDDLDTIRMEEKTTLLKDTPIPDTALARKRKTDLAAQKRAIVKKMHYMAAVEVFVKVLSKHDVNMDGSISKAELENALRDEQEFPQKYIDILFGGRETMTKVFQELEKNGDGMIHWKELLQFLEGTGVSISDRIFGYGRQEINSLYAFAFTFVLGIRFQSQRLTYTDRDIERTLGINTAYIRTIDFVIEEADKQFLIEQGRLYTDNYLRRYVLKNKPPTR